MPSKTLWRWPGLGLWNLYFLSKFLLYYAGYLDLKLLPNLVFAAFLLLPVGPRLLLWVRNTIAVVAGAALYYHDTWFPPLSRLSERQGVMRFSSEYVLELLSRFIDWQVCAVLGLLLLAYLLLRHWLRLTTVTLAGLAFLLTAKVSALNLASTPVASIDTASGPVPVTDQVLDEYLAQFYRHESGRVVAFNAAPAASQDIDIVLVNVCSMAWSDLASVGLKEHRFFQNMDVVFEQFNSATSYSGPAAVRLLRAGCGQSSHADLYAPISAQCSLVGNLKNLGYQDDVLMTHDGKFEGYLTRVHAQGVSGPSVDISPLPRALVGFDGTPIKRDGQILDLWWQQRLASDGPRAVLLFNTNSMHDGNRIVDANGKTRPATYQERAQHLFDDLERFILQVQRSGRRMLVVFVPEHGAGLGGDRLQISGMRELPSAALTHVPVALKAINLGVAPSAPIYHQNPSSYLALAQIISRLTTRPLNAETLDWRVLLEDLEQTAAVSENDGSVVLDYQGVSYIRMKEQKGWMPYPQRNR